MRTIASAPTTSRSCAIEPLESRVLLSATTVTDIVGLTAALANSSITTINVAAGTYELTTALKPQAGQSIIGAGQGQTIITGDSSWDPGIANFKDPGVKLTDKDGNIVFNRDAYLFSFDDHTDDVTISNLTLTGPQLHGALYAWNADNLTISDVTFDDFLWSGVRTFQADNAAIHDNTFVDAGGTIAGVGTGGAVYMSFTRDSVFHDNHIYKTESRTNNFMGFKGRKAENTRIHHNTIEVNFSIELPFENDKFVEIDHNYLGGTVSLPKGGGGGDPIDGDSFHIHHNYFNTSYAIEYARNGVQINNNLFDFEGTDQGGNLITSFGYVGQGATDFHNNLIKNPGRGIIQLAAYDDFVFRNNHIIADASEGEFGGRSLGLFGISAQTSDNFTIGNGSSYNITVGDEQIEVDYLANVTITGPSGNISVAQSQYVTVDSNGVVSIVNGLDLIEIEAVQVLIDDVLVDQGAGIYTHVTDFNTISIKDNIFELNAGDRPLSKNTETYNAVVENNTFSGVNDAGSFTNTDTGAARGVTSSFDFKVGANESFQIEDWTIYEVNGGQGTFAVSNPVVDRTGPILIQAEGFDRGANGDAYFDNTAGNIGSDYRTSAGDDVDINLIPGATDEYNVGWTRAGEYLEYTIDTKAGAFNIDLSLATDPSKTNNTIRVLLDGVELGSVTTPNQGWNNYQVATISNVNLTEGQDRVLQIAFDNNGNNFDWIRITPVLETITVQAEDFATKSNGSSTLAQVTEEGFLQGNIGFVKKNTWTQYSGIDLGANVYDKLTIRWSSDFEPPTPGNFGYVEIRTGSPTGSLLGTADLDFTGGWKSYQEQTISLNQTATGTQDIYLVFNKYGGGNPDLFNIDWFEFG